MADLGTFALLSALAVCAFGLAAGIVGVRRRDAAFIEAALRAVRAWAALVAVASAALLVALATRQFSIAYVSRVTSSDLPLLYTVAAFWGGHAGSLLLWALVLGLYGTAAVRTLRGSDLLPVAALTVLAVAGFFTLLLVATSNPFAVLAVPPPDGRGLNPLLLNPWMAVHPPTLYLGFVGLTIPFALAMAALVTGRLDQTWVALSRRWVLLSWLFLTLGLLFGAKWSYVVLGWGGYWAWDPVENAALMPWLTSTAFLHSIQVQERRGLLATWTVALIIISFALSIFGTFLTRSGILSSVHTFANSTIGLYFLGFLAVLLVVSFSLLVWRWDRLRAGGTLEAVLSRESAFLANNAVLLAAAFVVFFGTIFPVLAEAITGDRINVGPPYFNQVMVPLVALLLVLMGIGPLLAWRRDTAAALGRTLSVPAALALLAGGALAAAGVRAAGPLLVLVLVAFVAATIGVEFYQGTRVRAARGEPVWLALGRLIDRNRRRYGGYIVHLGILLILAGVTVSSAFTTQTEATLAPGESVALGRYAVRFEDLQASRRPGIAVTTAVLSVRNRAHLVGTVRASHLFHEAAGQATAEIGLLSTWRDDLYLVLVAVSRDLRATIRVLYNPLVSWIWAGGFVILVGALVAIAPARGRP